MSNIKNIIFDLGGVLIDIDYHKTINAFKALGIANFEEMYSQVTANDLFENLETGKITEDDFYTKINKISPTKLTTLQIKTAWNAILLNFRNDSIAYLQTLAKQYNLYLLSNTNIIHQQSFFDTYTNTFDGGHLNNHFTKAYYSHQINLRKPYTEIYAYVLNDANINANETLFIDDSKINIPAADELGIKTHLLLPTETIERVLPSLLI